MAARCCLICQWTIDVYKRQEVALKSGADGVHVGIEDAPVSEIRARVPADFIIGATCKTVEQAKKAEQACLLYTSRCV